MLGLWGYSGLPNALSGRGYGKILWYFIYGGGCQGQCYANARLEKGGWLTSKRRYNPAVEGGCDKGARALLLPSHQCILN